MKRKVLILTGYYVPSIKGGGPIQSIKNLVDNLSDKIDFYIIAADRDLGDDKPFENIKVDKWGKVGNAKVFYTDLANLTWGKIKKIFSSVNYDVIYLNSFFSYKLSIIPILLRKTKQISSKPIVMAPRGQFSPGALNLNKNKKKTYIMLAKALGLYKNLTWHATAEIEKNDIQKIFGNNLKINIANNLTANYKDLRYEKEIKKRKGELKIVFISRIHPKKNLKKAIMLLKDIHGEIEFNIYGPIEDKTYWSECERVIEHLPKNIKVFYRGTLPHQKVNKTFNSNHIFLFPTLGENFGHVISEALIGGCPVIISDQTPWKQLEKYKVGWDIPLKNEEEFIQTLNYCVNLSEDQYSELSSNAFLYGKENSNNYSDLESYLSLFG